MTPRRFVGPVVVEQHERGWILRESFRYIDDEKQIVVVVPEGFITDFASVPRAFWNIALPDDYEYSAAAIVHDRLYETHERTRAEADAIFYDAMEVNGTPRWKRWVMWSAVRSFGGSAYKSGPARQRERVAPV